MKKPANHLTGSKFGRLTVVGEYRSGTRSRKTGKETPPTVLCECLCGVARRFNVDNLRSGKTLSCGCFRKENSSKMGSKFGGEGGRKQRKYPPVESSARDLYARYMKRNGGNLSFTEFYELTKQSCYYCGKWPDQIHESSSQRKNKVDGCQFVYNGLDRIDSSKPYNSDNVRPSCKACNFMKHVQDEKDFYQQMINIINTHKEEFIKLGLKF